ncbi:hypothetical protein [Salibacterium aidingense]|uniref:hypothetical protein n=1 Tax=Salibacterium aidingense TaxID=384933 RepID=UPI003BD1FCBB
MEEKELLEYLEDRIEELNYKEPLNHDDSMVILGGKLTFNEIRKYLRNGSL